MPGQDLAVMAVETPEALDAPISTPPERLRRRGAGWR